MENFRKRMRFSEQDDLVLLREVIGQNPYENSELWTIIQENMRSVTRKEFTIRALKDHVELLIRLWLKDTEDLKGRSGTEYLLTEKQIICGELYAMMKEFKFDPKKKAKKNANSSKKLGIQARDEATQETSNLQQEMEDENINPSIIDHYYFSDVPGIGNEVGSTPTSLPKKSVTKPKTSTMATPHTSGGERSDALGRHKRGRSKEQSLIYLENYDKKHFEIKENELILEEKKLDLENRKITLQEKIFELNSFETRKKLELQEKQINGEIENRKFLERSIERQDKVINILLKLNEK